MAQDRLERWVKASHRLKQIEPFMIVYLQGLGHLDCELISGDEHFCQHLDNHATIEESFRLTHRFTLSYLWVLGAYELVRTLDERCTKNHALIDTTLKQHVQDFKGKIARLRMPLAKMQPARKHPNDSPIAYPGIHQELGIAWHIGKNTFITRRELSNDFLDLIEKFECAQG
jgi:hypothetical protein